MKLHKIEAGAFHVDGGAAFGVVPKKVWQKRYPADKDNYCRVHMRCLLIDTGNRLILIDAGTGDKQLEYLKFYGFEGVINFDAELSKLGYKAEQVTDVIFTHLHFDHCGGATRYNAGKTAVELVFPNAVHHVGETQWQNFLNPNVREGDSYFKENMLPIADAGKLHTLTGDEFLCPEIEMRIYDGHTPGQIVTYINMDNQTLVYCGDVIPLAANVPLAWISSYDVFPLTAMEEKKRLLDEAAEKQQILFFEHDAYTECCTVVSNYNKHKVSSMLRFEEVL
ncbi:MAG: putative metal-dependent hydrolase [Bacteroidetes bacterium]|nr:putative metal-dependent hydrolase [Bacteroidota bacterium]